MPASAVAQQVDDDILLELLPELERQPDHPHAGFRVVTVHMEDRCLDHPGGIGGVDAGAGGGRSGGEPDLVVDDDVHSAAGAVAAKLGQVQRLGHHALAGEGRVAVHEYRQHAEALLAFVDDVLLGPHDALEYRVDRLEVARVGRQRHRDLGTVRGGVGALRAQVVLHVAGAVRRARVDVALELSEDLAVALPDDVGQHVQPAAVRHPDGHLVQPGMSGLGQYGVQQRDRGLPALQREPLLPDVLRLQEGLERLRGIEPLQDVQLLGALRLGRRLLHPILQPIPLLGVLDVHVLHTDSAAVGVPQYAEDLPQRHHRLAAEAAGSELPVEVPQRQPVVDDVKVRVAALLVVQRIGVGHQVPTDPEGVDQCDHSGRLANLVLVRGGDVAHPAHRLVRDPQRPEYLVVEPVAAEQQLVHPPQEVAGLRALDDPMVVCRGQRQHLRHGEAGQALRGGALVLGRVLHRPDADDRALAGHQPRDRVHGADGAGIGEADRRTGEVVDGQLVVPGLADDLLVGRPEGGEVHRLGPLDGGHDQGSGTVLAREVDGQA